jgi:Ni/Fe-hydrogenase subunit HybB-like protein
MMGYAFLTAVCAVLVWLAVAYGRGRPPRWGLLWIAGTLLTLWAVTAFILLIRFTKGIGPISHLTDANPWGVWVGLLQAGVALSAGGFVMAATVHIFHIKRFEPILRPVVLLAFLGYNFVGMTLFIEVGRPYNLWHPLAQWQHHSIMFEVAWCVTLYLTVLLVEFSPVVFERLGLTRAVHLAHKIAIPVVILGVVLSTLHQSAMGSMFLIVPQKIHPLWSTTLLPVLALISAVAVGLCVTVTVSMYTARVFGKSLDKWLLADLAKAASVVLFLYGAVKIVDVSARGAWPTLFHPGWLGTLFIIEMVVGVFLPAALLARRSVRQRSKAMAAACLFVIGGVVLNRLTVSWFSMVPTTGGGYTPHWMELAVSLALFTGLATAFGLAVRFLPVYPPAKT